MEEPTCVYALTLQQGKYYIGKTTNLPERLKAHEEGTGTCAKWVTKYGPIISHVVLKENAEPFDEQKFTYQYMQKHHIRNVRGGSHCAFHLHDDELYFIKSVIYNEQGGCFQCGEVGHFVKDCPYCKRCGRNKHHGGYCTMYHDRDGNVIIDKNYNN